MSGYLLVHLPGNVMNPPITEPSKTLLFVAGGLILGGNVVRMVGDSIAADLVALVMFVAGGAAAVLFWMRRK